MLSSVAFLLLRCRGATAAAMTTLSLVALRNAPSVFFGGDNQLDEVVYTVTRLK
jgi:hypothetical protein